MSVLTECRHTTLAIYDDEHAGFDILVDGDEVSWRNRLDGQGGAVITRTMLRAINEAVARHDAANTEPVFPPQN